MLRVGTGRESISIQIVAENAVPLDVVGVALILEREMVVVPSHFI
jgi:hypothetical protein